MRLRVAHDRKLQRRPGLAKRFRPNAQSVDTGLSNPAGPACLRRNLSKPLVLSLCFALVSFWALAAGVGIRLEQRSTRLTLKTRSRNFTQRQRPVTEASNKQRRNATTTAVAAAAAAASPATTTTMATITTTTTTTTTTPPAAAATPTATATATADAAATAAGYYYGYYDYYDDDYYYD